MYVCVNSFLSKTLSTNLALALQALLKKRIALITFWKRALHIYLCI